MRCKNQLSTLRIRFLALKFCDNVINEQRMESLFDFIR